MLKSIYTRACLLSAIGASFLFLSCERDNVGPYIGEKYVNAPTGLTVDSLVVPSAPVNFENDSADIKAVLSDEVSWILTLRGSQSNAEKTFSGVSKNIDIKWNGSHDGLYFFRATDVVQAELSFIGNDKTLTNSFTISKPKKYNGLPLFGPGNTVGFESPLSGWPDFAFAESGNEIGTTTGPSLERSVQGQVSFYLGGNDYNNTYFIAGVRDQIAIPPSQSWFEFPTTNPDSIFFNVFVYGTGNEATMGAIGVGEDDDLSGTYEDARFHSEDAWDFQFRVNWTGWKLVSAPYSAFQRSTNPEYGGTGNSIREADRIKQITFNLLSSPPMNQVEIYYDYPIVTFGKPFNPHE